MRKLKQLKKQFIKDGSLQKNLLYATGEILLIVAGILIALAINNSNENKMTKAKEHLYLSGLKSEFEVSRQKLNKLIKVNQQNFRSAKKIIQLIDQPEAPPSEAEFSQLLLSAFSNDIVFNPINSLLKEMINSGSLKDVSNAKLSLHLVAWDSKLVQIKIQEDKLLKQKEAVIDFVRSDEYSFRTVLDLTNITADELHLQKRENYHSNLNLLKSRAFENNVLLFLLMCQSTEQEHYLPLREELNLIIGLLEDEIQK